jgi:tellurite methyltransferase
LPEPGNPTNTTMRICDHHIVPHNWDQHYASLGSSGRDPAPVDALADPLLIQAAEMLPPARALDLACGPGRHALYLARLGWHVTAVDSSAVAIGQLRAHSAGLAIDARLADLERGAFPIAPNAYPLICDFHYLQRDLFPQIREGVHPGGIFAGAIHLLHAGCTATPCNPDFLLHPGELRGVFDGWKVLFYSEGGGAEGHRHTARIIARRA